MADETQMDQGPAAPPQAKEEAKRGETHVRKAAEDLRSAADATTDELSGHNIESALRQWDSGCSEFPHAAVDSCATRGDVSNPSPQLRGARP